MCTDANLLFDDVRAGQTEGLKRCCIILFRVEMKESLNPIGTAINS